MPRLIFESDYDTDFIRRAFVFFASDGEKRFRCYLPYEEVADYYHLSGNADVKRHFNLGQAQRCAQASYDSHGLAADGSLMVKLQ